MIKRKSHIPKPKLTKLEIDQQMADAVNTFMATPLTLIASGESVEIREVKVTSQSTYREIVPIILALEKDLVEAGIENERRDRGEIEEADLINGLCKLRSVFRSVGIDDAKLAALHEAENDTPSKEQLLIREFDREVEEGVKLPWLFDEFNVITSKVGEEKRFDDAARFGGMLAPIAWSYKCDGAIEALDRVLQINDLFMQSQYAQDIYDETLLERTQAQSDPSSSLDESPESPEEEAEIMADLAMEQVTGHQKLQEQLRAFADDLQGLVDRLEDLHQQHPRVSKSANKIKGFSK